MNHFASTKFILPRPRDNAECRDTTKIRKRRKKLLMVEQRIAPKYGHNLPSWFSVDDDAMSKSKYSQAKQRWRQRTKSNLPISVPCFCMVDTHLTHSLQNLKTVPFTLHPLHPLYIHPRKPDFIVDGTRGLVKKYVGSLFESYFEIIFLTSFAFVINYVIMILISECFVKREFCNIENKCSLSKWRQIFNVIWIFENCVSIVHHFYLRHKM